MELIDGNAVAKAVLADVAEDVSKLPGKPCVTFVRVGEDPASVSYVNKKQRTAAEVGIESRLEILPETTTREELLAVIDRLNADPGVHGILVQSPIGQIKDEREIFNRVSPLKDVDGFNAANVGKLCQEDPTAFVACTPAGIIELLLRSGVETSGKRVAVVGRSLIVGKPVAMLMMQKGPGGDATVTVCHSRTQNLPAITREADILVAAIGRAHFITADMVKDGAVVIDVGINRIEDASRKRGYRLVGDVDFDALSPKCSKITPVPGGVGPMTVAMLMKNTAKAYALNPA
ncbi:MAG: bifunctional 5,10-methylenetetrahydrofolate dehydrogenase/5,10-methenyltetrahydrofolate cyclohydrolase [Verrucomicrobiota bacterium]